MTEPTLPSWADPDRWRVFQRPVYEEVISHYDSGIDLVVLDAPTGSGKSLIGWMVAKYLDVPFAYICTTKTLQQQFVASFPDTHLIMGKANYTPTDVDPGTWRQTITCADCTKERADDACEYCSVPELCPYTLARDHLDYAMGVCTNVAYFMGECSSPRSKLTGKDFVIADECHNLSNEVKHQVSISISRSMKKALDLDEPEKKTKVEAWVDWFDYAIPVIEARMKGIPRRTDDVQRRRWRQTLERLHARLELVRENSDGYVYTGYDKGYIEFKPITADRHSGSSLLSHGKRWLLMSASVGSPEQLIEELGYQGTWAPVFASSTFDVSRRPIFYCPVVPMRGKAEEARETLWPQMAKGLEVVLDRHPDERVLVHTHAYQLTTYLAEQLEDWSLQTSREVFFYRNAKERDDVIRQYESLPASVMLAPSLDEGYDGADDKVRVVVIAKIPFAYLGDKQVAARRRMSGGETWYASEAAKTILQMMGRGMRHEGDHFTGYILDAVFGTFYSKWIMKGPEKFERTHRLFPNHFTDSVDFDSDARFEVRRELKRREREEVAARG